MSIPLGLSSDALRRIKRMEVWIANFKILGPDVSGQNTSDGAAYRIARPTTPFGAQASNDLVPVKVTGLVDGATRRYLGNLITGKINSEPDDTLSETDVGTVGTSQVEVWNLSEIDSGAPLNPPTIVLAQRAGRNIDSEMPIYFTQAGSGLTLVALTTDGGTCPSFTYTAKTLSGDELGTHLTPQSRITGTLPVSAAAHGLGMFVGGDFVLALAFEALNLSLSAQTITYLTRVTVTCASDGGVTVTPGAGTANVLTGSLTC